MVASSPGADIAVLCPCQRMHPSFETIRLCGQRSESELVAGSNVSREHSLERTPPMNKPRRLASSYT